MESRAKKFRYVGSTELQREENQRKDNHFRQKFPSDKGMRMDSNSMAASTIANEVRFPGENTDDAKSSSCRELSRAVHRLIILVIILTVVSISTLVLLLLLFTGVVGPKNNVPLEEPKRMTTPSFQEMMANMTTFKEMLINQIETQLKQGNMNFSGSGAEMDAAKLWTEINITKKTLKAQTEQFMEDVGRSQENFTEIYRRFTSLSAKMETISKKSGLPGPSGYNGSQGLNGSQGPAGPPGPKGAGNFSQCQYKFAESVPVASGSTIKQDISVFEANDKKVVGATCSTNGAKEYRLSSEIVKTGPNKDKRMYMCKCAGQADIMKNPSMKCFIHYWECPLVT